MPLLTPQLLQRLREIVERHHAAFVVNAFGKSTVAPEVLKELEAAGLVSKEPGQALRDAYLYGHVMAAVENPAMAGWPEAQFQKWLARNPVVLSPVEEAAVTAANLRAATYCVGLGNTVAKDTGQLLIEADAALRGKLMGDIKDATIRNVITRQSVGQLKSALGWAMDDWSRDLDRIAVTEKHNALTQGEADAIERKAGPEARCFFRPAAGACSACIKLHIGPDGHPRIFRLSQLAPAGANVKQRQENWVASKGSVHPHCACRLSRIPDGWGFNAEGQQVPGGEFGVEVGEEGLQKAMAAEDAHQEALRKALSGIPEGKLEKARKLAGRMDFQGLQVSLEHQAGDTRHWYDPHAKEAGTTTMKVPYGYVRGTEGVDGDHHDVFMGPDPNARFAYVVHARKKVGVDKFGGLDEQKTMLGFSSAAAARAAYLSHYNAAGFYGGMDAVPMDEFKRQVLGTRHGKTIHGQPVEFPEHADGPRLVLPLEKSLDGREWPAEPPRAAPGPLGDPDVFLTFGPPPDAFEKAFGAQVGTHKYIHREYAHGHWVYEYAKVQGGHLSPHPTDPDKVLINIPAHQSARGILADGTVGQKHVLESLAGKYGVSRDGLTHGHMVSLPITHTQADAIHMMEAKRPIPATMAPPPVTAEQKVERGQLSMFDLPPAAKPAAVVPVAVPVAPVTIQVPPTAVIPPEMAVTTQPKFGYAGGPDVQVLTEAGRLAAAESQGLSKDTYLALAGIGAEGSPLETAQGSRRTLTDFGEKHSGITLGRLLSAGLVSKTYDPVQVVHLTESGRAKLAAIHAIQEGIRTGAAPGMEATPPVAPVVQEPGWDRMPDRARQLGEEAARAASAPGGKPKAAAQHPELMAMIAGGAKAMPILDAYNAGYQAEANRVADATLAAPSTAAAAPAAPIVARSKDFAETGNYTVTFPDGYVAQIFRDPESKFWFRVMPSASADRGLLGATRAEALEALQVFRAQENAKQAPQSASVPDTAPAAEPVAAINTDVPESEAGWERMPDAVPGAVRKERVLDPGNIERAVDAAKHRVDLKKKWPYQTQHNYGVEWAAKTFANKPVLDKNFQETARVLGAHSSNSVLERSKFFIDDHHPHLPADEFASWLPRLAHQKAGVPQDKSFAPSAAAHSWDSLLNAAPFWAGVRSFGEALKPTQAPIERKYETLENRKELDQLAAKHRLANLSSPAAPPPKDIHQDETPSQSGWNRMPPGRITSNDQLDPDKQYVAWTKIEAGTAGNQSNRWTSSNRPSSGSHWQNFSGTSKRISTQPVAHGDEGIFPVGYDPNTDTYAATPAPATAPVAPPVPEIPETPKAMQKDPKATAAENRQRAREAGEHIGASRKDAADLRALVEGGQLDKVSYADAARFLKKESLMPVLDAVHYQQEGASPGAAHMAITLASLVGSKPPDSDEYRKAYVEGVRMVAGGIQKIKTTADAATLIDEIQKSVNNAGIHTRRAEDHEVEGIALGTDATHGGEHPVWDFTARNKLREKLEAKYSLPAHSMTVMPPPNGQGMPLISTTSREERDNVFRMMRALGPRFIAGLNLKVPKEGEREGPWGFRSKFRYSGDTATGRALQVAKAADVAGWDAYLEKNEDKDSAPRERKTPDEKQVKWKQSISELPEVAGTLVQVAKGDPARFKDKFGFTGVQPGQNLPDDEYEYHVRHAEMAFTDLAGVLGLAPDQVSMNGRLGVRFASTGTGKAAAHYEPSMKAINITRFKGAGTLAHEWGHFLDNVTAEIHGGSNTASRGAFASEGAGNMPPELKAAFTGLRRAMTGGDTVKALADMKARLAVLRGKCDELNKQIATSFKTDKTPTGEAERLALTKTFEKFQKEHNTLRKFQPTGSMYSAHAAALDGYKSGGYWSEGTEMFARAFEAYVQDKIEDTGTRRNSYLVDGTRKPYEVGTIGPDGNVAQRYPQGEERKRINAAFDVLFQAMHNGGHFKKALQFTGGLGITVPFDGAGDGPAEGMEKALVYHGTSRQHAENIKANGFHPASPVSPHYQFASSSKIAARHAHERFGDDAVVVAFDVPLPKDGSGRPYFHKPMTDDDSMWLAPKRDIPASYVTAVHEIGPHNPGPFIGPKGGKWADAAHTVAWSDDMAKGGTVYTGPRGGQYSNPEHTKSWTPDQKHATFMADGADQPEGGAAPTHEHHARAARLHLLAEKQHYLDKNPGQAQVHADAARKHHQEAEKLNPNAPRTPQRVKTTAEGMAQVRATMDATVGPGDKPLRKSGGPFIGPRGGKWADAQHTVAWDDNTHGPATKPALMKVHIHEKIAGEPGGRDVNYHVTDVDEHHVMASRHEDGKYGAVMPRESLKHFQNDLAGKVELTHSGNPDIDAVASGKAKFLGKGDDGMAFKVGDKVVKVSTTVPYNPDNPGHRTPDGAMEMMRKQVEVGNKLADLGIPGIQRSKFESHGDKGFQIKPWVEIPEKFTPEQLDKIQATVLAVHKAGYAIHDQIQPGLDEHGEPVMFDIGKAAPLPTEGGNSRKWAIEDDIDQLSGLYRKSGVPFVRKDKGLADQEWEKTLNRVREPKSADNAHNHASWLASKVNEAAKLKYHAPDADKDVMSWHHADALHDVWHNHGPISQKELDNAKKLMNPEDHGMLAGFDKERVQKSVTLQATPIPAWQGAVINEADGNVTTGSGINLQADGGPDHHRPIPPTGFAEEMRDWLLSGSPRTSTISRDPHVYETGARQRLVVPIDLDQGVMATAKDPPEDTLMNQSAVQRLTWQNTLVPRNYGNPGWAGVGSRYLADEGPRPVVQVGPMPEKPEDAERDLEPRVVVTMDVDGHAVTTEQDLE